MSHEKEPSFGVKALNSSSVANFSSTEDDSYILIVANNCNTPFDNGNSYDTTYNNNNRAALFGVNLLDSENNQEAYIGIRNNNLARKIAKFNSDCINLDVNTVINGNIIPSETSKFDLGSIDNKWNSLFLNNTLFAKNITGDGSGITNLNFNRYNTSYLNEGSNLYWTQDRFDNSLSAISLDDINPGTTNTYITDNTYFGDLLIDGTLSVQSLVILDFEEFKQNNPDFDNIDLTYNITQVIAKNTSVVPEGSNLYFTKERVQEILDVTDKDLRQEIEYNSNIFTSNIEVLRENILKYIDSQNDTITSNYFNNKFDYLSDEISNTSNSLVETINSNLLDLEHIVNEKTQDIYRIIDEKELTVTGSASSIIKNILPKNVVLATDINGLVAPSIIKLSELSSLQNITGNIMERFNEIDNQTLDNIEQGTTHKFIMNDKYDNDLFIDGTLSVSNLNIIGSSASYETDVFRSDQLNIVNEFGVSQSVIVDHRSVYSANIVEIKNYNHPVLYITSRNRVGLGIANPVSLLHVNGTVTANHFKGEGDVLTNVYIGDKTTTELTEGENKYFTQQRVDNLINLTSCDRILQGSSNKFIEDNKYADDLTIEGGLVADYLFLNGVKFTGSNYVPILHIDNMVDGTSNKMIINNTYNNDLRVNGTIEANNLLIHNNISLINNSVYSSECLDIMNYTESPSINVLQIGTGDIMRVDNDYSEIFVMKNNGFFGNINNPVYNIDIEGTTQSTYFKGDGSMLKNVNIKENFTNDLQEGSNLYFTTERVYEILFSSNYYSSNPFTPYLDEVYENTLDKIEELKKAIYGIELDHVIQGSNNKYIVNNIYNDSLVIDGTLTVRQINIIDDNTDYQKIYNDSLFSFPNSAFNYTFDYNNISNVVIDVLTHTNIQIGDGNGNVDNAIINNKISVLQNNFDNLQNNVSQYISEINNIKQQTGSLSLDMISQGSSNRFIEKDLYNSSLFIDGQLTVKNINIIDDAEMPIVLDTGSGVTTSQSVDESIRDYLLEVNYEKQINTVFETLSYQLETQNTEFVQKINNIANDIMLIKSALNI
jgi:hypothetical protein